MSESVHDQPWFLYLIECKRGQLYAGITVDVPRRYEQHAQGKGARYTRANPPKRLVGCRKYPDRSTASTAEWAVKQLPKKAKIKFIRASNAS